MRILRRILNISEAKRVAAVQGLTPCVNGGGTVRFVKNIDDKQRLGWQELEELLKEKNMDICEIGGYMKIVKKTESE